MPLVADAEADALRPALAGRHDAVTSLCREGFHDMRRLLDRAGIG